MADPIKEALASAERLDLAARLIGARIDGAAAMRDGALRDAGDLMAAVEAHNATCPAGMRADVSDMAQHVGLSRPTMYRLLRERDPQQSTAELARQALGCGLLAGGDAEEELTRRRPELAGWRRALDWLRREGPLDAWQRAHPGEESDIEVLSSLTTFATTAELAARYRQAIEEIAAEDAATIGGDR